MTKTNAETRFASCLGVGRPGFLRFFLTAVSFQPEVRKKVVGCTHKDRNVVLRSAALFGQARSQAARARTETYTGVPKQSLESAHHDCKVKCVRSVIHITSHLYPLPPSKSQSPIPLNISIPNPSKILYPLSRSTSVSPIPLTISIPNPPQDFFPKSFSKSLS